MNPTQLLPILAAAAVAIFTVTISIGGWWIFQLHRTAPHRLTPTTGHVKLSSVWVWIARATMLGQVVIGIGLATAGVAVPEFPEKLIVLGCLITMVGAVGVVLNTLPGQVEKYDTIWDEETISGPRSQSSTKRMTLSWDGLKLYNRNSYFSVRLKDHDGRTVYWTPFHLGHRAIDEAIARNRPDLINKD